MIKKLHIGIVLLVASCSAFSSSATAQVNLAGDPRYAAKLAEMEAALLAEMRRLDDPYRLWNQPDDGLKLPQSKPKPKAKVKNE